MILPAHTAGKPPTSDSSNYKKKHLGNQRPRNLKYSTGWKTREVKGFIPTLEGRNHNIPVPVELQEAHAQATWKVIIATPLPKSIQNEEYSSLTSNSSFHANLGCKGRYKTNTSQHSKYCTVQQQFLQLSICQILNSYLCQHQLLIQDPKVLTATHRT